MTREATIERNTKETEIRLRLNLDGSGKGEIDTGIGFLIICWTVFPAMDSLTCY